MSMHWACAVIFNALTSFEVSGGFSMNVILALLFLGFVPGLFALVLYYYGLKSTHASVATIFELAFPLSFFIVVPLIQGGAAISLIQYTGAGILIASTTLLSILYADETTPDQFEEGTGDQLT